MANDQSVSDKKLNIGAAHYIRESIYALKNLRGTRIEKLYRVSIDEDEDALHDYYPLVLETKNSILVITLDEAMSNIFIVSSILEPKVVRSILEKNPFKIPIIDSVQENVLSLSDFRIEDISIISKNHKYVGWCVMSGLNIKFSSGDEIIVGTKLTDLEIPGVWVIKPSELDQSQGWEILDFRKLL